MFKKLMLSIIASILIMAPGSIADEKQDNQRQKQTFGGGWDSVMLIKEGQKIELKTRDEGKLKGTLIFAKAESIAIRYKSGERSINRTDVLRVRVYDANRRIKRGIMWTAIGTGVGMAIGFGVCVYCYNEHGSGYVGAGAVGGAGVGALGFLSSPYKTVYEVK
jgi:hypothetical protein